MTSILAKHLDMYLLDAWLPDLDGFELCRQMRGYDSHTPILFFSSAGCEADKKMGHQARANAYVINEPAGVLAANRVRLRMQERRAALRGEVVLLRGNTRALGFVGPTRSFAVAYQTTALMMVHRRHSLMLSSAIDQGSLPAQSEIREDAMRAQVCWLNSKYE